MRLAASIHALFVMLERHIGEHDFEPMAVQLARGLDLYGGDQLALVASMRRELGAARRFLAVTIAADVHAMVGGVSAQAARATRTPAGRPRVSRAPGEGSAGAVAP